MIIKSRKAPLKSKLSEGLKSSIAKKIIESKKMSRFSKNSLKEAEDINPIVQGVVDSAIDDLALEVADVQSESKADGVTEVRLTVKDDGTNEVVSTEDIAEVIEAAIDAAVVVNTEDDENATGEEHVIVVSVASEDAKEDAKEDTAESKVAESIRRFKMKKARRNENLKRIAQKSLMRKKFESVRTSGLKGQGVRKMERLKGSAIGRPTRRFSK